MMKASTKRLPGRNNIIDGVTVRMGGQDWLVAPLTLGQLRRLWPQVQRLGEIGAGMGEEEVAVVVDIVTAALQRTYPDLTSAKVEELLDLGNAGAVFSAVLTGSGLRPAMGEAVALGALPVGGSPHEPNPGAEARGPSGARSTASSPQPADTATRS